MEVLANEEKVDGLGGYQMDVLIKLIHDLKKTQLGRNVIYEALSSIHLATPRLSTLSPSTIHPYVSTIECAALMRSFSLLYT